MIIKFKTTLFTVGAQVAALLTSAPAYAQQGQPLPDPTLGKEGQVFQVIERIITFGTYSVFAIAVILVLIGAYYYVTAGGDAEKTKTARTYILYALVGVILALLARGIVALIRNSILTGI